MASIKENRKNGKIISFKFRAFLGRDGDGKQCFKSIVWKPDKNYSEERLRKLAEKEAAIWEREEIQAYQEQASKFISSDITFEDFVKQKWLPHIERESRATTIEFRLVILKRAIPYFENVRLADIDSKKATNYLEYYKLRKEAMEKLGITDEAVDTSKSPTKFIIMNKYVRFAITIIASLSICIALLYNTGIDGDAFAWIALIVILISIGVVEYIHGRRVAAVNEEEAKHMVIDEENETAIMLQRSRISASFLSYETVHYMNYKNHSAKLVYTGATVGGIHTGGFHTTEAYTSESAGKSSDKAHVFVRYEGGKIVEIKKIKLTPELLAEAKKNKKISKFIVKDYINLRSKGQETKLTESEEYILSEAMKTNDTAMQYHITQRAFIAQFLHKDDIKNIVNWVSGDDYL